MVERTTSRTREAEPPAFAHPPDAIALSPNVGPRKAGLTPRLVVLHYTGMATAEAARARLSDPAWQVSAHYLIGEDGHVWGLAPEPMRAWHAGVSRWDGIEDVNSASIGVELAQVGPEPGPAPPFPEPQMAALVAVLRATTARWSIPPRGVVAHSDVAPGRKIDPGPKFDWARLARAGLARPRPPRALWAEASGPADPTAFAAALGALGYGAWPDAALLQAFRLRWRPEARASAPLEAADLALARALAAAPAGGAMAREGGRI